MKYAWIDAQRREFPLPDMCEVLTVSISGYRAWRSGGKPDRTRLNDPQAVALMKSIHAEVKAAYGSRRMHRELQGRGHRIGLSRAAWPAPSIPRSWPSTRPWAISRPPWPARTTLSDPRSTRIAIWGRFSICSNRRFNLRSILERLARAACQATPCRLREVRAAVLPC